MKQYTYKYKYIKYIINVISTTYIHVCNYKLPFSIITKMYTYRLTKYIYIYFFFIYVYIYFFIFHTHTHTHTHTLS